MQKFDAVVTGSGHNGLITACYLAKNGYRVCVLERQKMIGGAVSTETMFRSEEFPQGFQMDVGSSVHIMIHQTGIIEELGLTDYGLDYIELYRFFSYMVPDSKVDILFFTVLGRSIGLI